jgi:hypothetical protein
MDSHTKAINESVRSIHECCLTAAIIPSGTARPQVTTAAAIARMSVFVKPSRSTSNTGWCRENDWPKSKLKITLRR